MDFVITQLLNSLVLGVLLFMMSAGLSLIFGLMNVVNIAHGSFFMIGAFTAYTLAQFSGNFWFALGVGWIPAVAAAVLMERVFIRPLYKRGHLDQVLLTFGFIFVFGDICKYLWGADIRNVAPPEMLEGSLELAGAIVPKYRLFLVCFGGVVAAALWWFLERSRIGAMVRAGVDDAATAAGIGINVPLLFGCIFALGAALAAIGGIVASPILGVYLGMDVEILIPAFIVTVVGGMGSLRGALVAAMLVGAIDTFGKAYFPDYALFLVYLLMVVVLLTRPQGLFGIARA
ncbi:MULTISPECIES: branched-chain amino acid ABC transporter permease [Bordetella]|uniref:ABC transport system, membrane protein n=1 Tax=Bordetella bronchiseptica (strain ATCC BAA-588 / NCTC 13252 / RB50) TaxID=257310 RepID=A0A0H3LK14_BORBR|nr:MULTISPECIES: branched-chain amino acid ABC transporter permease [Bordetella]KAK65209.1 branched-chain amino acid ABC transporter, permease protein [Bordetella bronchiseptica 980-2]KCV24439.1 branched-chain amino acid ABC transporter, permease protein [Bordetella bronchiseptica 00-P-2730]KDD59538.1 branched-chain amino acid ABC transporter, permease protein [Bordetella bronchiseptica OSU553]AMG87992.1 branched-chain amino acid ABC transporter permease [Bordetella bronchiseptica]ARP77582.1 b